MEGNYILVEEQEVKLILKAIQKFKKENKYRLPILARVPMVIKSKCVDLYTRKIEVF